MDETLKLLENGAIIKHWISGRIRLALRCALLLVPSRLQVVAQCRAVPSPGLHVVDSIPVVIAGCREERVILGLHDPSPL